MVWCLLLILESTWDYFKYFFCSILFFFSFWYSNYVYTFWNGPIVIGCFVGCFSLSFSSLHFSLSSFHWPVFKFTDSFLGPVKSTDGTVKDTLYFWYCVFPSDFFLKRFHLSAYSTHLACCQHFLLHFNHGYLTFQSWLLKIPCLIIPTSVFYLSLVLMIALFLQTVFFSLFFCMHCNFFVQSWTYCVG